MGVWGKAPSEVQGQSPWSGKQGLSEAETILAFGRSLKAANLPTLKKWKRKTSDTICVVCKNEV